ncbi:M23 family metallopeptidase [Halosquirtibacter laminarini]|uniref:M23 family metallopeptidase n=1 Tax=Halosquirtibacter laminarini TaxID=3374600 RepID=A0AC61NGI1_9BACT|nr:M23 family metallopeptidase [Prolixibacteraceae bacterium]
MIRNSFWCAFVFLLLGLKSYGQFSHFVQPVKIPIRVAGSFGELRSNHFHSGIDIKTNGKTGLPVHVVETGYISRIKVSPWGFGYALYVNHPNGYTTVYGHLSRFAPRIDKWVKAQQYKRETFAVDLTPSKNLFRLKRDELIAYSGNSGSSGGPHLHYEVRKTSNQEPMNPATRGLKIKDTRKPLMHRLYVYPMTPNCIINGQNNIISFPLVPSSKGYAIKGNKKIYVDGKVGFGIEVVDYVSGSWSKCGINHAYLTNESASNDTLFAFDIDKFHFYETRYINAHIDYPRRWKTGRQVHRMYKLPGNRLSIYRKPHYNSILAFDKSSTEVILKLGVSDSWKNSSTLSFRVGFKDYKDVSFKNTDSYMSKIDPRHMDGEILLSSLDEKGGTSLNIDMMDSKPEEKSISERLMYNSAHYFHDQWFTFKIDSRTLYQNTNFIGKVESSPASKWSPIYSFYPEDIALHRNAEISFRIGELPDSLLSKAYVGHYSKDGKRTYYAGGIFQDGWVKFKTRSLGRFTINIDTISPRLRSLTLTKKSQKLYSGKRIRFVVKDLETGISHYRGEIDGKYALFTYDAKNSLFEYKIDPSRLTKGVKHRLHFLVKDNCNNITEFNGTFVF